MIAIKTSPEIIGQKQTSSIQIERHHVRDMTIQKAPCIDHKKKQNAMMEYTGHKTKDEMRLSQIITSQETYTSFYAIDW